MYPMNTRFLDSRRIQGVSIDEIIARYDRWQIIGPPEIRGSIPVQMFTPFGERTEPPLELAPSLDGLERFLARLFPASRARSLGFLKTF
jgi:hypothetical protein